MMTKFDFSLIGGGIVGVSTALTLQQRYPDAKIVLIEKESLFAAHQTGHNSGVVHAGVYYEPGSLKAEFCKKGVKLTHNFCKVHELPYRNCGKLLVATDSLELERMQQLKKRCQINQIPVEDVTQNELTKIEPNIIGVGALRVKDTAITDYTKITCKMVDLFRTAGGIVKTAKPVTAINETSDGVTVYFGDETIQAQYLIACAGLQADRVAQMMNIDIDFRIIPFRGEYYQLNAEHSNIVSHLIYPIPDPALPFLGVHLTPMISGAVTIGPNAVLGWKREGYGRFNVNFKDISSMMGFSGFWKVIHKNMSSGIKEFIDANYKPGYLKRIQKYCPSLMVKDLRPYPAGIRAQAVRSDGSLVHDFLFAQTSRSLHVCNAPSPAATSAIPIGEYICDKVKENFKDGN
ncbi:MAG: L-2-hydroxyglutarate oxidase [Desulfobacteraceae bacterium]|nr:L-2-hydroxyglutarate oxidase [Desulfobacteraceae bacterium]